MSSSPKNWIIIEWVISNRESFESFFLFASKVQFSFGTQESFLPALQLCWVESWKGFALHVVRSSHPCTSLELQNILLRGKFFCCFICLHQLYASSFVSPFLPQVVIFPPQLSWREINNWFHPPCLFPSWMNPNPSSVLWPARWLASDCSFQKEKYNHGVQREFNLSGDVSWFGPSCCTWTERVQVQHHQKITSGLCWIQSIAPNTALTAHSSWVVNYSHSE